MYWPYYYPHGNGSLSVQGWDDASVTQQRRRVYSEDLLHRNIGKTVTVYLTFENNPQWPAKKTTGTLRGVGRDFIVVRDRQTGKDHMFLNINIDYVVFDDRPAALAGES
ncbi:spore coat protein GerQ [Polycladomyces sp. WAk]|uniref:Spore coat protein GerQ n=1 Tax=Polycladomyces zharkentensis TaxID=2807616 RepID=A0ABS2WH29_9BACL|nr:spore coat protein GerQ [Polycladomyces sp. WAk]